MSPEAQNIAIAEACVMTMKCCRCRKSAALFKYGAPVCSDECAERASDYTLEDGAEMIPDYLNDLNAMHEAVMSLTTNQRDVVNLMLCEIACTKFDYSEVAEMDEAINATAAQRAEAFLKCKGLWI